MLLRKRILILQMEKKKAQLKIREMNSKISGINSLSNFKIESTAIVK